MRFWKSRKSNLKGGEKPRRLKKERKKGVETKVIGMRVTPLYPPFPSSHEKE